MVKMLFKESGVFYSRWYYALLLVGGASVFIGYIFSYVLGLDFALSSVFLRSFFSTFSIWAGCMAIVTYTWKKFPWERMPVKHLIIEITLILLFLCAFISLECWYFSKGLHDNVIKAALSKGEEQIVITFLITFLITSIHEAVFFYRQWKLNFSKSVSLEKDNIEARYKMLKAQINPHFLFNSLNSLMTLIENNPKAEEYVQELSEFLRYVMVSNDRELVTLEEEMNYLDKYIYLQKIRFGNNLQVNRKEFEWYASRSIPPLVLQMLFDNCIKHNVITSQRPLRVTISVDEHYVTVSNNLQPKHTTESIGHGLKNIEGRMRLLSALPLKIYKTDKSFTVSVPLIEDDKS